MIRFRRGVADRDVPGIRTKIKRRTHRLAAAKIHIRQLKPGDADAPHPLQVPRDAALVDGAARPVPPGPRLRGVRWIRKTFL